MLTIIVTICPGAIQHRGVLLYTNRSEDRVLISVLRYCKPQGTGYNDTGRIYDLVRNPVARIRARERKGQS